jgi:hypothetical protein
VRGCSGETAFARGGGIAQPVDPLAHELRVEPLEELLRVRTTRLREEHLSRQPRQERRELLGVALLVEEIRAEHDVPRRSPKQRLRLAPADARQA